MVILDMGSGNTCLNDKGKIREMIDAVPDTSIVLKWQLFEHAPPNIPLTHESFDYAYHYAAKRGFKTTSSVFDIASADFLNKYSVPFVKIANKTYLYSLAESIDRRCIISVPDAFKYFWIGEVLRPFVIMACISDYPATVRQYRFEFPESFLFKAVSDHTEGLDLYYTYKPKVWEKHFVLERGGDNPDAGPFAITPKELEELCNLNR